MTFIRSSHILLLLVLISATAMPVTATTPGGTADGVTITVQQPEPKSPKKITASVLRSLDGEQVILKAYFPEDYREVRVAFYNILGRLIEEKPLAPVVKGEVTYRFETNNLPNGPYVVILETAGQRITNKVMLRR